MTKNEKVVDKVEGANAPELAKKVEKYNQELKGAQSDDKDSKVALNDRLEKLINFNPVMLFMKGNPSAPQCGFSRKIVDILNKEKIKFQSFNILSDEEVRQGLKVKKN